jgi:hypothetical protein
LIDLSIDPKVKDKFGLTAAHFACAGGIFDICRELDNIGLDFATMSRMGSPARFASEFGRDGQVFWLWTRGALLLEPQVGWSSKKGGDPDVLCAAALHGHSQVVRILVESVGIRFNGKLSGQGESAVRYACQNGHDEVLGLLFELGARVSKTALPAAIRSGSFKCVELLLARNVKVDSSVIELATACGHADVLGRLLRVCSDFGCSWMIGWLDGFGDGQRLLQAAGAGPTWTVSGVELLMRKAGKAAEFAGIVSLPETLVGDARWKTPEFHGVVARLIRDGTATAPLLCALVERNWPYNCSPFATCSTAESARLAIPGDVTTIGNAAFCGISGLVRVEIPSRVIRIGSFAFRGCSHLVTSEIPSSVRTIGDYAFCGCSSLVQVKIPSRVATIGESAFEGCSGVMQVVISSSGTVIGNCAFRDCSVLTRVEIPSNVATMGIDVFDGVRKIERLRLVGSRLSPAVVAALRDCLTLTAKVNCAALTGQRFGRFTITSG